MIDYSKYLILASNSKVLAGSYDSFLKFREVEKNCENVSSKRIDTYLYRDNFYKTSLKQREVDLILECCKDGVYRTGLDKANKIATQVGLKRI